MIEPEQTLDFEQEKQKIYENKAIRAATFFGGPLVAGYLIAENFKAFHDPINAKKAWLSSIFATALLFGIVFIVPHADKIPSVAFPLAYSFLAFYLVERYQGKLIQEHLGSGGKSFKWWRALLIGLAGAAITFAVIFAIALLIDLFR
jgi:hypothetical protein